MSKKFSIEDAVKMFGSKYANKYDFAGYGKTVQNGQPCIFVLLRVPLPKSSKLPKKFKGFEVVIDPVIVGDPIAL